MKKFGCLLLIIGIMGLGGAIIPALKNKEQKTSNTVDKQRSEECSVTKEKKEQPIRKEDQSQELIHHNSDKTKYKLGYDAGYLVGKTAASEGRPIREYDDLYRHGYLLGNKDKDFARGFYYGWRTGYHQRLEYMKATGEKPKPYDPWQ
ncbi:hypothetical protein [uncultured Akkermansia sp.]|uniref:hypothetical protein n=6 Tax=uncultured Akkermansia sp. TaxID=512294 RepID=UPI002630B01B|nr:hypothetical protein [uncultured Akkermansia sp.]